MATRLEAEIVATGDELMSGAVQDSNTAYLCRRFRESGVRVRRSTMVGDAQPDIEAALREATSRARIVMVTGGLGPTEDDRTSAAAAAVAGVALERDEASVAHIKEMFRRFGREMTPNNSKQADFPKGADVLPNPVGTAPGFAMTIGKARVFFAPGVPTEMKKMVEEQVLPRVAKIRAEAGGPTTALATRVIKTFGYGESKVESELVGIDWPREITVGYRAKMPEIHLRLYAEGDAAALPGAIAKAEAAIRQRLGERVFGVDDDSMASVVGNLLKEKGWKLAAAESCTGGMIGSLLTEVPGSSAWFDRGFVTYSNESKTAHLGVSADLLKEHGAVSEPVVRAMATGALAASGCPIAVSVTGIAGPDGGSKEKPVGTIWFGCATKTGVESRLLTFAGDRDRIRKFGAWTALDMVRRRLLSEGKPA